MENRTNFRQENVNNNKEERVVGKSFIIQNSIKERKSLDMKAYFTVESVLS